MPEPRRVGPLGPAALGCPGDLPVLSRDHVPARAAGAARGVTACFAGGIGSHPRKRDLHVTLPVAAIAGLVLRTLTTGIGGQAGSRSAGSSGRPTSARIRWLIASVIPKVSH